LTSLIHNFNNATFDSFSSFSEANACITAHFTAGDFCVKVACPHAKGARCKMSGACTCYVADALVHDFINF
jgi:hypothetical protein